MTTTKKLLDNNMVETTIITTGPRYTGRSYYSECACECIVDDIKENCKIWTTKRSREGFESLDTKEEWEPEGNSVCEDIELFQEYLDNTYGKDKYEAYALGAYIHSTVSFAFNKSEDNRCRWDSGTVGFIGINKECYEKVDLGHLANELSDAWNGWIHEIEIYDEYEEEVVDSIYSTESSKTINEWKAKMKEEYGVENYTEEQ